MDYAAPLHQGKMSQATKSEMKRIMRHSNSYRWDRNQRSGGKAFDWMNADDEKPDFLQVRTMANLIAKGFHLGPIQ